MKLKEDIKPISYIKTNAADMLKKVNTTHRPIIITQNGEAKAVLMDTDSYEKMNNAIGILKLVSQAEKDVASRKYSSGDDLFKKLEKKLSNDDSL